ncbi:MAG: four helix bundle protein [Candidatus Taylorbacteria bacterium]
MEKEYKINSCKDLIVWQKSLKLSVIAYHLTKKFPREEMYGLTSQIRRAAVSIPSNIAEGRNRNTKKDFIQFLKISFGSTAEIETQMEIASELQYITSNELADVLNTISEITRMLHALCRKLSSSLLTPKT